jgi:hypothetical protein
MGQRHGDGRLPARRGHHDGRGGAAVGLGIRCFSGRSFRRAYRLPEWPLSAALTPSCWPLARRRRRHVGAIANHSARRVRRDRDQPRRRRHVGRACVHRQPPSRTVVGLLDQAIEMQYPSDVCTFGIRLHPLPLSRSTANRRQCRTARESCLTTCTETRSI